MDVTDTDISKFLESEEAIAYAKQLAAACEEFLEGCGKQPLEVYRIEKFKPTLQPDDTYGKFYEGDSYVVLKEEEKLYQIHYWHGKECTADEMGSSAAFAIHLSGHLPKPSHHHLEE